MSPSKQQREQTETFATFSCFSDLYFSILFHQILLLLSLFQSFVLRHPSSARVYCQTAFQCLVDKGECIIVLNDFNDYL